MRNFLVRNWLLMAFTISALAVLVSLGNWQVRRLHWKETLIADISARIHSAPKSLVELEKQWAETGDVDYYPVSLSGTFDHAHEAYFYNTHNGMVGWDVITPMKLADGRNILINRGFVTSQERDPAKRSEGQVTGNMEINGLARNPLTEKPNSMIPDNAPKKKEYYWKDFSTIAENSGLTDENSLVPFMVDAEKNKALKWPMGGTTLISFPNNHLQYAITWYGLAVTLLLVGGGFLWSRRR